MPRTKEAPKKSAASSIDPGRTAAGDGEAAWPELAQFPLRRLRPICPGSARVGK